MLISVQTFENLYSEIRSVLVRTAYSIPLASLSILQLVQNLASDPVAYMLIHPPTLIAFEKSPEPVIPVRVQPLFIRVKSFQQIRKSPFPHFFQCLENFRCVRDMSHYPARVINIDRFRRDIEIPRP